MKIYNTNLNLIIKRVFELFLYPIYWLSYLSPRNKKIWVFGYPYEKGFTGNIKYLFLYIADNKKNKVKAIWISKKKNIVKELKKRGYEAYYNKSFKGIYYVLRAKYFFVDTSSYEINYWLSGGSKKIVIWHASPFKKIGLDASKGKYAQYFQLTGFKKLIYKLLIPWGSEKTEFFITTSSFFQKLFAKHGQLKRFPITGFPRNDIYFDKIKNFDLGINQSLFQQIKDLHNKGKKIIFYLPTWRDSGGNLFADANFDFVGLKKFLSLNKAIFIFKFHPAAGIKDEDFKKLNSKEFLILPSETDIYPILSYVDILITDYSSAFFDFLLLDKPIIFFPYDYEEYTLDIGFYFDYKDFTPGPKAYNFNQLIDYLKYSLNGKDEFKEKRS